MTGTSGTRRQHRHKLRKRRVAHELHDSSLMQALPSVLALAAVGCGDILYHDSRCVSTDECDPDYSMLVRWQFETYAGDAVPCPVGADLVEVTIQDSGASQSETAELPCSAGETWFYDPLFPPTSYRATVRSADRSAIYATTVVAPPLTPRAGLPGILLAILVDAGYLDLEWTFANGCQKPGEVVLTATPDPGGEPIEVRLACDYNFQRARIPLPAGEYDLALFGTDAIGSASAPSQRVRIEAPNKLSARIEFHLTR